MTQDEWGQPHVKCLTVRLSPINPEHTSVMIMLNAAHHDVDFTVPKGGSKTWTVLLDTAADKEGTAARPGETISLAARSILLLESPQ
jgi:isoamylase